MCCVQLDRRLLHGELLSTASKCANALNSARSAHGISNGSSSIELLHSRAVTGFTTAPNGALRVSYTSGSGSDAVTFIEEADVLIGADGRYSAVRKAWFSKLGLERKRWYSRYVGIRGQSPDRNQLKSLYDGDVVVLGRGMQFSALRYQPPPSLAGQTEPRLEWCLSYVRDNPDPRDKSDVGSFDSSFAGTAGGETLKAFALKRSKRLIQPFVCACVLRSASIRFRCSSAGVLSGGGGL